MMDMYQIRLESVVTMMLNLYTVQTADKYKERSQLMQNIYLEMEIGTMMTRKMLETENTRGILSLNR